MAFVNLKNREIQTKIVYYGPGRGGKTTNLEYIYKNFGDRIGSKMVTVKTQGDRTLFFDFFPLDIGRINGYKVKVKLYTVPGQIKYDATRKLVLNGVDGVVFVADALMGQRKSNIFSLKNLYENLKNYQKNIFKIPLVFQYNKIDLLQKGVPIQPVEVLEKDLNQQLKRPSFAASALFGTNVVATLKKIISMTTSSIKTSLN
jgi:signal recognition particle receptor subunit beta